MGKASQVLRNFLGRFRTSILAKITLPYLVLSLIVAVGGAYLITQLLMLSVDRRFQNSLIEIAKISADLLVREEELILENLRLTANLKGIEVHMQDRDAEALREMVLPLAFNSNEDMVHLLDLDGIALLSLLRDGSGRYPVYDASKGTDYFSQLNLVTQVLAGSSDEFGDKYGEIVFYRGGYYLCIAGPVVDQQGALVGVVVIGRSLDEFLLDVRRETLAQVTVYTLDGAVLDSTLPNQAVLDADLAQDVITSQDASSFLRNYLVSDIGYQELTYPFEIREKEDAGIIGVALSTDFLANANQEIRSQVFLLIAVLLFLTVITGFLIARMITRPILKLKSAALQVSGGNLEVEVQPIGEDEIAMLTSTFNMMVSNLKESNNLIIDAYDKTLEGWSKALELRDRETEGHTLRVTEMTLHLARLVGIQGTELENIRRGALIHDIGKFAVPDNVLLKPDTLTEEEFEIIKLHPVHAYEMLCNIPFLSSAIDIPYCHHEKWNGTGYPRGLKGEEIPLAARLFSLADVWDALTTDRPYRAALEPDQAIRIITEGSGLHFDPALVDLFLDYLINRNQAAAE